MNKTEIEHVIKHVVGYAIASEGHQYVWGGAPGPEGLNGWDCSSACDFWWGRVGGQTIPGYPHGSYDGTVHGPTTVTWLASQGTVTGAIPRQLAEAGDLAVWPTHMGLCINNQEMMSAQDPANGTRRSGIDGFIPGEPLTILRLAAIGPGGVNMPLPPFGDPGRLDAVIRNIARQDQALVWNQMKVKRVTVPPVIR